MEVQASFSLLRTIYHNIRKQKRRMFRKNTKGVYKYVTEAVAGSTFSDYVNYGNQLFRKHDCGVTIEG
jgi:hypothetical protein